MSTGANQNRVNRVLLQYREENFDRAVADISAALGIDDFEDFIAPVFGLRIAISWDAGIELVTPHGDGAASEHFRQSLAQRGEGLTGFVFGVADLDAADRRAAAAGFAPVSDRIDCFTSNPGWRERFASATESVLPPVAGLEVTLIELKAR